MNRNTAQSDDKLMAHIQECLAKCKIPENEHLAYKLPMYYYEQGGVVPGKVWLRLDADGIYEARAEVTILGWVSNGINNQENPFADDFYENYVKGRANSREKAIELLVRDHQRLVQSLWEI